MSMSERTTTRVRNMRHDAAESVTPEARARGEARALDDLRHLLTVKRTKSLDLTARETEIMVAALFNNIVTIQEQCKRFDLNLSTMRSHRASICLKMDALSFTHAVVLWSLTDGKEYLRKAQLQTSMQSWQGRQE